MRVIVVDAHQNIAHQQQHFQRDYRRPVYETRQREGRSDQPAAVIGLPDALLGRVAIVFTSLFARPRRHQDPDPLTYATPQEAYRLALAQMDIYQRLSDESPKIRLIEDAATLDEVLTSWDAGTDIPDHVQGLVLTLDGGDPIIAPAQFEEWYERGVRMVAPAWHGTRYSGGVGRPGRLTREGWELLDVLAAFKVILDVSHMAQASFDEAVRTYPGPIIASHSNPRRFCDSERHLSDDMIRQLAERDGVIGLTLYNQAIRPLVTRRHEVRVRHVLEMIDHVCQVTGSAEYVGLGSDLGGSWGAESLPEEMDTVTDLWWLGEALRGDGYDDDAIRAILGGNLLRVLRASLSEA